MDLDGGGGYGGNRRSYNNRPGPADSTARHYQQPKVCFHWRAGRCTRVGCPFLHRELAHPPPSSASTSFPSSSSSSTFNGGKRGFSSGGGDGGFAGPPSTRGRAHASSWGGSSGGNSYRRGGGRGGGGGGGGAGFQSTERVCNYWAQGNCSFGEKCRFLHSWNLGDGFSLLADLEGHKMRVTGIAMSADKLYTGSQDRTVRVWDCNSGKCLGEVNVGDEVGCILSEGPWIFVGIKDFVKAWNTQTNAELSLSGPVGRVYSLAVGNDLLFAGTQDGTILVWKFNVVTNNFEPAASLTGHSQTVVTLIVGANRLFSGSMDHSIRVWSLETLQCVQTLTDHTSVVMSVLCWDQFLLSCSLDNTIKVWALNESGSLEVTYTHTEEHGLLAMRGLLDLEGKPILLCSCNDNVVRLYDLPSFSERGKIFAKQEVRAIQAGPGGLFFIGDGTGQVRVWTCVAGSTTPA